MTLLSISKCKIIFLVFDTLLFLPLTFFFFNPSFRPFFLIDLNYSHFVNFQNKISKLTRHVLGNIKCHGLMAALASYNHDHSGLQCPASPTSQIWVSWFLGVCTCFELNFCLIYLSSLYCLLSCDALFVESFSAKTFTCVLLPSFHPNFIFLIGSVPSLWYTC